MSVQVAVFVPFLTTCLLLVLTLKRLFAPTSKRRPPSPLGLPVIGNLHQLGTYPQRTLHSLSRRYGPLMLLRLGSTPALIVSSPEFAREIMKTQDLAFSNRPRSSVAERLLYHGKDISMAPYGEYWRQARSICVLQLLSLRRVQSFRRVREEEVAHMMEEFRRCHARGGIPLNLSEAFASLTNDIICRVALGRKHSGDEGGRRFQRLLQEFVGLLGNFYVGDFIPSLAWVNKVSGLDGKVDRVAREFDEFLDEVVEQHLLRRLSEKKENDDEDKNKDFVDVLLDIQKDGSLGFHLEKDSIKAIVLDMFAAGTDTTHTVLEWAMTHLLRHPAAMERVQAEVRGITAGEEQITERDLDKMQYLKAAVKETLRLYPPIPLLVPRSATQDVKINGFDIDAGTTVITNAWAIGRDPGIWDGPEEFRPERFVGSAVDYKGQDFELIPFGAGRRGCPGTLFAMATNEMVLANLMKNFDWQLPEGVRGEDLDMSECTGLTIHRRVHLHALATPVSGSN